GYIELSAEAGHAAVRATAGRQELTLGNERLLGPVDWSNTGQAFDALRVQVTGPRERVRLIGFAAVVREYDRVAATGLDPRANEGEDRDHGFFGLIVEAPRAQLFLLHDRNAAYRSFTGVDRTTVGARAERTLGGRVRLEAEGAYQLGNQLALGGVGPKQDIGAWLGGGRIAWLGPPRPLASVGIGVDWLAGDANPGDTDHEAFHTLYGTNHRFYGFMDLFLDPAAQTGDRGLVDGIGDLAVRLSRDLTVNTAFHVFRVTERPAAGGRTIGSELDITVPYALAQGTLLQAGYGYFRTGAAAALAGLGREGTNLHWAYLLLQATF
ncbi:MAG: alginate export family protein, partial [Gemmatimonadetes bacterium]|nr:alginate export family protein [Gemmatimonadota bacterium]